MSSDIIRTWGPCLSAVPSDEAMERLREQLTRHCQRCGAQAVCWEWDEGEALCDECAGFAPEQTNATGEITDAAK